MRRATCSTRRVLIISSDFYPLRASLSFSLSLPSFQLIFNIASIYFLDQVVEASVRINCQQIFTREGNAFLSCFINRGSKWIWSWRVCRFWDKLIGNGGVGRVYTRGYIIVEWIFNVYLILTALNASSFGSFELESLKIVNKFYFIERRERTLIRLWLRVHIFFSTTLCPRTQNLHSKIFKYQKGGNLIPSWLKSTLTRTISLFKL